MICGPGDHLLSSHIDERLRLHEGDRVRSDQVRQRHSYLGARLDTAYDRLASHVKSGEKVLDIGCGTGAFALRAARRSAAVKAIDISSQMLEIARAKAAQAGLTAKVEFVEMGVAELDREDTSSYDAVMSGLCFSELTDDELVYALKQATRILKPGGLLLVADEVRPGSFPLRLASRLVRLPLAAITYLLTQTTTGAVKNLPAKVKAAGFSIESIRVSKMQDFMELVATRPGEKSQMKTLAGIVTDIVETLLRFVPFPTRTGLVRVGHPDRSSPVLLTCNYHLTVHWVKRAIRGLDAYLLVANSRRTNVWCGAAGGHFTSNSVISVLKTSGIEAAEVHKKTGRVVWGPVYATDIPQFISNGLKKPPEMRQVAFPWAQRVEMAAAWALPISVVAAIVAIPFWRQAIPYLVLLVWVLSLSIFVSFPLYKSRLNTGGKRVGFVFFDFGRGGFQLISLGIVILGLVVYGLLSGNLGWGLILRWGIASLLVILMLSIDLTGSTPVYKSGLLDSSLLEVVLDTGKCRGAGFCEEVCPRNCYEVDEERHTAAMPGAQRCVHCGACVVQCPFDGVYFRSKQGEIIPPDDIRRFKLNMMGKPLVRV